MGSRLIAQAAHRRGTIDGGIDQWFELFDLKAEYFRALEKGFDHIAADAGLCNREHITDIMHNFALDEIALTLYTTGARRIENLGEFPDRLFNGSAKRSD